MCYRDLQCGPRLTRRTQREHALPTPPYVLMLEYGDVAVDIHVLLLKNRKTEVKDGIPWRSCFSCQGHVKMSKLLAGFPSFSKNTLNPMKWAIGYTML